MKSNKKVIRLTESDLHNMIAEAVREALNEIGDTPKGQYMLGRVQGRQINQGNFNTSRETASYATKQHMKKFPQGRTSFNRDSYDNLEFSNELGRRDERDPELSKAILNQNDNIGTYHHNVRNNSLRGYSKF